MTFEQWIRVDIDSLKTAGVFQDALPQQQFFGSPAEREAWTKYQSHTDKANFRGIGRSLYTLQLEEWYDGMRLIGRDPKNSILVVRNEDMKTDADRVYTKIQQFLGLTSDNDIVHLNSYDGRMKTHYSAPPIQEETQKMLMELFEPYNKRLYKLLGGGEDDDDDDGWKGVYDGPTGIIEEKETI
eukprot:CAMPEP_0202441776 /NCGR_PEP_ID=MMETSP1360-20130828/1278_1 /ASSEMBLY_ACC=CAM_ASM_000848 /TAXON_ID=515479 /ORGANISM="Licmophora paradoxa, Strain CCMP2313" /LENGTH=183 /DNA_ID=CAMNT_0049056907 /DNA_START=292 /DNA_END=843 /DNA_ORIENTATION=-